MARNGVVCAPWDANSGYTFVSSEAKHEKRGAENLHRFEEVYGYGGLVLTADGGESYVCKSIIM